MPILFSTVSRGVTILAKNATCTGNFLEVTEQVLGKIKSPTEKLTYAHGKYVFKLTTQVFIILIFFIAISFYFTAILSFIIFTELFSKLNFIFFSTLKID